MADSDLDPQAFLKTVRDLSDKRQKEDNERFEKLEAQIIQDRNARLERKLERERSLSPEKTPQSTRSIGPSSRRGTPTPTDSTPTSPKRESLRDDNIRSRAMSPLGIDRGTPRERSVSPSKASPSSAMPSRSNTMSWQRRPQSGIRSRPLSMLAHENNVSRTSPIASPEERPNSRDDPTRNDIAQALGSKDPAFFRQTADRGLGSAAYRRNREEDLESDTGNEKRHLPGLTRNSMIEPERHRSPPMDPASSSTPSRFSSVRNSTILNDPIPENPSDIRQSTNLDRASTPEAEKAAFGRSMPSLSHRMASDRPPSPTKGMGGFVQSAMLKRNDSVNKRWSAQPAGGLSRENSTASIRTGYDNIRNGLTGSSSMPKLETQNRDRSESDARPSSRDSTISAMSSLTLQDPVPNAAVNRQGSLHSRAKSMATLRDPPVTPSDVRTPFSPPLSPSKRFSPTKSSWLESALARPESPKPAANLPAQPSWMAEINKAKQRNSAEANTSQDGESTSQSTPISHKRASTRDLGISGLSSTRNVTPPTKSKPPSLTGKPSLEAKVEPKQSEQPSIEPLFVKKFEPVQKPAEPVPEKKFDPVTKPAEPAAPAVERTLTSTPPAQPLTRTETKSKPETPPKKDFRSNLKPRDVPADNGPKKDLEFRNAMGKLKRTQTEKYVAPDLLKDNIMRGKAGLALSDGPQKTQRRDELKESLLKKKEEMKAKAAEEPQEEKRKISPVPAPMTPEALMKKKQLGRSESVHSIGAANPRRDITPEALARHKTLRGKPEPNVPKSSGLSKAPAPAPFAARLTQAKELEEKGEPKKSEQTVPMPQQEAAPARPKSVPAEAPKAIDIPKSNKIADRFNPGLANILARGPPGSSQASSPTARTPDTGSVMLTRASEPEESGSGKQLTHMTKSRAKGPKRRKPNSKDEPEPAKPLSRPTPAPRPASIHIQKAATFPAAATSPLQPPPKSAAVRAVSSSMSAKPADNDKPKTPQKSASLSLRSTPTPEIKISSSQGVQKSGYDSKPIPSRFSRQLPSETSSQQYSAGATRTPASPHNQSEEDKENQDELPSVKNAAATWGKASSSTPSRSMPIKLPSKADEEAAMKSAGLLSTSPMRYKANDSFGLGISDSPKSIKYPLSPPASAGLPPRPAKSSRIVSNSLKEVPAFKDVSTHQNGRTITTPAGKQISSYLGMLPECEPALEIDTQAILSDKPNSTGTKTLRRSIQEITPDGKLVALPGQEEHILFDSSIYAITHVYGSATGARITDVYLWAGESVSDAFIDDSQLFAKRVAKEAGSGSRSTPSVTVVRQGAEPAGLFQALGGIVIVRKGSRSNTANKRYMLCGRPHIGHVAFDEVEYSTKSLSSAFPYIVVHPLTIQESKVYLWRGSGCGPEATGSARLISMDLNSSSSDVVEVAEGQETEEFLTAFAGLNEEHKPTDLTSLHGIGERLSPRLFRIDALAPRRTSSAFLSLFTGGRGSASRPASAHRPNSSASNKSSSLMSPNLDAPRPQISATEISPLSQAALDPENVYILDCIGKIYVLTGPLVNTTQYWQDAFTQALLFANDYAILAASLEDRNRIPIAEVVFGSLPVDATYVFRRWDERRGLWGTAGLMAGRSPDPNGEAAISVREALDACCFVP